MEQNGLDDGKRMKYFTIEEAERSLPVVDKLLSKAQRLSDKIAWLLETNDVIFEVSSDEGFHYFVTEQVKVNKQFHRLYYQFYRTIEELDALGVVVKDIEEGLIDFPFKVRNDDAFLCWRQGEGKIKFWRSADDEMDDRRQIVDVDELYEKSL